MHALHPGTLARYFDTYTHTTRRALARFSHRHSLTFPCPSFHTHSPVPLSTHTLLSPLAASVSSLIFKPQPRRGGIAMASFSYTVQDDTQLFRARDTATVLISVACSPGRFLDTTLQLCVPCPAGSVYDRESFTLLCEPCGVGHYQAKEGQTECRKCLVEEGEYQVSRGKKRERENRSECRMKCDGSIGRKDKL